MLVEPIELPWLPEPSEDFRLQVRLLHEEKHDFVSRARHLAGFRLSGTKLHALGQAILTASSRESSSSVTAAKLGVLSNGTADLLLPAFAASAMRHGVWLDVIGAPFDQVGQQALDPASLVNRAKCDFILLAVDDRGLALPASPGETTGAHDTVEAALSQLEALRDAIADASGAVVILQTLPQVPAALFGSLDRSIAGSKQWLIDTFNRELRGRLRSGTLLLDVAALAETLGLAEWHDPVQWGHAKLLMAQRCVPLYADWLGRLIGAAQGKSRKCLVMDLDNTLWGGVIGDDGLAGIVLGNGNATGEAFLDVQKSALALRNRGVILAVSSKNDDEVARSVFRSHPEMVLREEHIAVFQANWQDKASNLRAIAGTLNIGVDSLVFLDDNPAERALVRRALPEVAVPELPDDPAFYARTLLSAGYFESIGFTQEDRDRAAQYQANAARASLKSEGIDLDGYLRSLEMKAIFSPFDRVGRTRITQLINKTNQFNLTTLRYSETDVEAFEKAGTGLTLQIRLSDRFGDSGMVAVVICVPEGEDWIIDTWLMSCRVLNRRLEEATLNWVVSCAKDAGIRALLGRYSPTERNGMVKDHYPRLGFAQVEESISGTVWRINVAEYQAKVVPIRVSGSEAAGREALTPIGN